jgi:hypothetical protein
MERIVKPGMTLPETQCVIVRRGSHGYISIACRPLTRSIFPQEQHTVPHIFTSAIVSGTACRLPGRKRHENQCVRWLYPCDPLHRDPDFYRKTDFFTTVCCGEDGQHGGRGSHGYISIMGDPGESPCAGAQLEPIGQWYSPT